MKKGITVLLLLTCFLGAKAEEVVDVEVDYSTVASWTHGWISDDAASRIEFKDGCLHFKSNVATTNYYDVQFQPFPAVGSLDYDASYTITIKIKGSVKQKIRGYFSGSDKPGEISVTTDWQTLTFSGCQNNAQANYFANTGSVLIMCGDYVGEWWISYVKISHNDVVDRQALCYNYITKAKIAEVISNPIKKYKGVVEIPATVTHEGETYTVTKIGDNAFSDCSALTSVTIPNGVTSIGNSAFVGCSGLTSATISNSVSTIGDCAFSGCSSLKSITIPNKLTSIGISAFANCSGLTSVTIPNSVTTIGYSAFSGCSGLSSITISNSVTSIGNTTFSNCINLTSVNIPYSVNSIDNNAFYGCTGLTSVTIPNSVTSIGSNVFQNCSSLESISIGSGMKSIGSGAFANCSKLTDVYCLAEKLGGNEGLNTETNAFDGSYIEYAALHVPAASLNSYMNTDPWKKFQSKVAISNGEIPETPKCAKPEISFINGKVSFSCETEGVEYISEVTLADTHKYYDSEIELSQTYKVSVYATKANYINSDVTTREIVITGTGKAIVIGDVDGDGKVNVADHVKLSNIIMEK